MAEARERIGEEPAANEPNDDHEHGHQH
jgi:hypothetical protein